MVISKQCTTKLDIWHQTEKQLDQFIYSHVNERARGNLPGTSKTCNTNFLDLPENLQLQILNHVPYLTLLHCRQVSTRFRSLVESLPSKKFHYVTIKIADFMNYRPWMVRKSTKTKSSFPWPWKKSSGHPPQPDSNCEDPFPKLHIKARKMIVYRLVAKLFDNTNKHLLSIVENVTEINFVGMISGRNFQRIFESCPRIEVVRFNIASHGGPIDTPLRLLTWPWKPISKLRTVYEWKHLKQIEFNHSCQSENVDQISTQRYFDYLTYFNRGILTNRILCETPGIQVYTKSEWEDYNNVGTLDSGGMGLVILKRVNQDFYFLLHKELLKITLIVNILCLHPISLASILRDAHEIY